MISASQCPPADVIAAFAFGELDAATVPPVQTHVSQCESCLATVGHLAASRSSTSGSGLDIERVSLAAAGQQIDSYRLVRKLGEGGMGEVWEAEQQTPVRRTVALKLLKAGLDTRQIVARFEAERQMLASMQHPSIAQMFDAGVTESGRPYFVMEYVNGTRITDYCDRTGLGVRDRLLLFQQVCDAVQHAHQKGIIHRDIKPSNVLLTQNDHRALPKVIDFGLAKLAAPDVKDATLTEVGTVLGTPAYASPEQMGLGIIDVDTRSDVYSLGVLLYELLIGVIPFEAQDAQPAALIELRRSIRDVEPTRPSARLSKLGERATEVAKARGADAASLRRQLRGDLDWIVMKALEKDRARRYTSPADLARDAQRYLDHEPVLAGPPTNTYRFLKFVQRHRVGTAFATLLATLIVAFAIVSAVQVQRVAAERDRANSEAAKASSINTFLQEMLGSADPWQTGSEISMRETLQRAANKIDVSFKDQPLVAAAVHRTIGKAYFGLGRFDDSERELLTALRTRERLLGREHVDVAECLVDLSALYQEKGDYDAAEKVSAEALVLRRKLVGERHAQTAESLLDRAQLLKRKGEFDGAARYASESLGIREQRFGPNSEEVAQVLVELGSIVGNGQGDLVRGGQLTQHAYDIRHKLYGRDDVRTGTSASHLGSIYLYQGKPDRAEVLYREALESMIKTLGSNHPDTIIDKENLANSLARQNRFDESSDMMKDVLAQRRAVLGEDHRAVARTMVNIAILLSRAGKLEQSEAQFKDALPRFAKAYGAEHPDVLHGYYAYGVLRTEQHEYADAKQVLRDVLAVETRKSGPKHLSTARTQLALGEVLSELGERTDAEQLLAAAHETLRDSYGADAKETREAGAALENVRGAKKK